MPGPIPNLSRTYRIVRVFYRARLSFSQRPSIVFLSSELETCRSLLPFRRIRSSHAAKRNGYVAISVDPETMLSSWVVPVALQPGQKVSHRDVGAGILGPISRTVSASPALIHHQIEKGDVDRPQEVLPQYRRLAWGEARHLHHLTIWDSIAPGAPSRMKLFAAYIDLIILDVSG